MTNVFISGAESQLYFPPMFRVGCRNFMVSYFYLLGGKERLLEKRKDTFPGVSYLIDSGAHTFIDTIGGKIFHKQDWSRSKYEAYLQKYVSWALQNRQHFHGIVELDVEENVGWETVRKWEQQYFEPLEDQGINVLYVWHPERGDAEWERMTERHAWVGLGLKNDDNAVMRSSRVNSARTNLSKVHGFGFMQSEFLAKENFYSVDSTTWTCGTKFGELCLFDGRLVHRITDKRERRRYKWKFAQAGLDWEKIAEEDPYEVSGMNVLAYVELEKFLKGKGRIPYWELRLPRILAAEKLPPQQMQFWAQKYRLSPDETDLKETVVALAGLVNAQFSELRARFAPTRFHDLLAPAFPSIELAEDDEMRASRRIFIDTVLPKVEEAKDRTADQMKPVRPVMTREEEIPFFNQTTEMTVEEWERGMP